METKVKRQRAIKPTYPRIKKNPSDLQAVALQAPLTFHHKFSQQFGKDPKDAEPTDYPKIRGESFAFNIRPTEVSISHVGKQFQMMCARCEKKFDGLERITLRSTIIARHQWSCAFINGINPIIYLQAKESGKRHE